MLHQESPWIDYAASLILLTIGSCYAGAYVPDAPAPDGQWSGNCGPPGGLTCHHDINYFCEQETGECVHCDVYCMPHDYLCEKRCPEWYAQNVILTAPGGATLDETTAVSATTISSQWQGDCGPPGGPTCLHDIDHFCEQETGECVPCNVYCLSLDYYMCKKKCPEWYAENITPTTAISTPTEVPQSTSSSTITESPSNLPQTIHQETTPGTTSYSNQEFTTENEPQIQRNTKFNVLIGVVTVGLILIILVAACLFQKIWKSRYERVKTNEAAEAPATRPENIALHGIESGNPISHPENEERASDGHYTLEHNFVPACNPDITDTAETRDDSATVDHPSTNVLADQTAHPIMGPAPFGVQSTN